VNYKWIPTLGRFDADNGSLVFRGGQRTVDGQTQLEVGNIINDQLFGGGTVSAKIEFLESVEQEACELILHYAPTIPGGGFITAGLGGHGALASVRTYVATQTPTPWTINAAAGMKEQLKPKRVYSVTASVRGSRVDLTVDGVHLLSTDLRSSFPMGQTGIWCIGKTDVRVSEFSVTSERPRAFAIMQFSTPYNELFADVIKPVCDQLGLQVSRADDAFGPGVIIADIAKQILEAKIVIAEITPKNPNVFYEVGYAHALNKPTILIAEKPAELPFDVSPFRTLFYENSIAGKAKIEAGLRRHLEAIQQQWVPVPGDRPA